MMISWEINGEAFVNCNCDYGCPCQFSALPTHGDCMAVVGLKVDKGHYGDINLDGVKFVGVYKWPGPVHEGEGHMQIIVDTGVTDTQREALEKIIHGEDTEEMATMWAVYSAMSPNKHPTLTKPIDLEIDIEERQGKISIAGMVETSGKPIPNIVSGEPHRARIDLPDGFEYRIAEIGSASTNVTGDINMAYENSHGQWSEIHLCNSGII